MQSSANIGTDYCGACGGRMLWLLTSAACANDRCSGKARTQHYAQRADRIVGRVPDRWYGVPAAWKAAEGRPLTMCLWHDSVPVFPVIYYWLYYRYSSSSDCEFRDLQEKVRTLLNRPNSWELGIPAESLRRAEQNFRDDSVLLYVRP